MAKIAIQPMITRAATAPAVIFAFCLGVVEWSIVIAASADEIAVAIKIRIGESPGGQGLVRKADWDNHMGNAATRVAAPFASWERSIRRLSDFTICFRLIVSCKNGYTGCATTADSHEQQPDVADNKNITKKIGILLLRPRGSGFCCSFQPIQQCASLCPARDTWTDVLGMRTGSDYRN